MFDGAAKLNIKPVSADRQPITKRRNTCPANMTSANQVTSVGGLKASKRISRKSLTGKRNEIQYGCHSR